MTAGRPKEYKTRVFFSLSCEEALLSDFIKIAKREGKPTNNLLQELMAKYVKVHGDGNPSFSLEPFLENPLFVADPAIRETNEIWEKYLSQHCSEKELAHFQGIFKTRYNQSVIAWKKKKRL